jgi:cell shape-determining protein MreC
MKMNYLQRNRRGRYGKQLAVVGAVLVIGWLAFSLLGGAIVSLVSPVWRGENAVSRTFRHAAEAVKLHSSLVAENLALRDRVASLELELAAAPFSSVSEVEGFGEPAARERAAGVTAAVLTRPPQSPYDLFVIDAGEHDGLTAGAIVSLPEGPVLGTVSDVFASSAKVKLFSTAGEETSAVLERDNVPVVLEGAGGGTFKVRVPRETAAVPGDRILSADSAGNLLAVVEGVEVAATDSFKEILARSPANIFSVRTVSVSR